MMRASLKAWTASHKERLAYGLVAALLLVMVGTGVGGFALLRHSANIQRQTLRLQALGSSAQRGADVEASFGQVAAHDGGAGKRLRPSYRAFLRSPRATTRSRLEAGVDAEVQRLSRDAHSTYPVARIVLGSAAISSLLLIAVLIWLFEVQRRAGRIDRDNAERSSELARLRDEFVAVVSHELRTPLTSILGFIDLIGDDERGRLSADQQDYFDVVKRNANRLLYLVSDLLLIAEADDGRLRLDVRDVDLRSLAHDSVEAARVAAEKKQIELKLAATPARLQGDPLRLAQLMDNLISNAIKFTPEGGRVTVTTTERDGHASLEVRDSGIGIAAADREQIFERFFRARTASTRSITGAGLGLAITKAIVDAHGGEISVDSEVGAGTSFRIALPLGDDPLQSAAVEEPFRPRSSVDRAAVS